MSHFRRVGLSLVLASLAAASARSAGAAGEPEEKHQMGTVYLVLLKKGPAWTAEETRLMVIGHDGLGPQRPKRVGIPPKGL